MVSRSDHERARRFGFLLAAVAEGAVDSHDKIADQNADRIGWLLCDRTGYGVVLHPSGPLVHTVAKSFDSGAPPVHERSEGAGLFEEPETSAHDLHTLLDW